MSGPASVGIGPPLTPPRVSLVNSVEVIYQPDSAFRATNRTQYESCDGGLESYINCGEGNPESLSEGTDSNIWTSTTIELIGAETCSTFGNTDEKFFKNRAEKKLLACQSKQLEYELWTGFSFTENNVDNNYLASDTAVDITSNTAVEPEDALDALEDVIADAGCTNAFIHVSPFILAKLVRHHDGIYKVVDSQTGKIQYYSPFGNKIISGGGYPGTSPNGDAPTNSDEWIYASAPVVVKLGPVHVSPDSFHGALDRTTNTVTFRATRLAQVEFDDNCLHFAAKVKRNDFLPEISS